VTAFDDCAPSALCQCRIPVCHVAADLVRVCWSENWIESRSHFTTDDQSVRRGVEPRWGSRLAFSWCTEVGLIILLVPSLTRVQACPSSGVTVFINCTLYKLYTIYSLRMTSTSPGLAQRQLISQQNCDHLRIPIHWTTQTLSASYGTSQEASTTWVGKCLYLASVRFPN
jgi:hypothetical protein